MRGREALLAALVFMTLALAISDRWNHSHHQVYDVPLYRVYGERIAAGRLPYRDFRVEYPPGALPAFALPALVSDSLNGFTWAFAVMMALCGAGGILVTRRSLATLGRAARTQRRVVALLALSPLLLGAVLLTRFDLLPALVVAAATHMFLRGRDRAGAVLLGIAIAVKVYPVVLLPLFVAWMWRRSGRRDALTGCALALAIPLLTYLPFFALAPGGVLSSIGGQIDRPLQIESVGAAVLLAVHHLAAIPLTWSSGHGSQNLDGNAAVALAALSSLVQIAALLWVWAAFAARRSPSSDVLVRHVALALAIVVALGKVLSPQFLVWLLFAVPLVAGSVGRLAGALYACACALTAGWFPYRYWALVKSFDPFASWLVGCRDLALLALVVVLAQPLVAVRRREQARSPSPGPSPGRT